MVRQSGSAEAESYATRLQRFLFGDDIFISYSHADGVNYATALANTLTKRKFLCYLDAIGPSYPDHKLSTPVEQALLRSSILVVVGSKGAARSTAVQEEIVAFARTRRKIIPIAFDDLPDQTDHNQLSLLRSSIWKDQITGLPVLVEPGNSLPTGIPSDPIVECIVNVEGYTRRNRRLMRVFWIVLLSVIAILGVGIWGALRVVNEANRIADDAEASRQRAQMELRTATDNLGLVRASLKTMHDDSIVMANSLRLSGDSLFNARQLTDAAQQAADAARDKERIARANAQQQEKIARSIELASTSSSMIDDHLDKALPLSLQAFETAHTLEARRSLFNALMRGAHFDRHLGRVGVDMLGSTLAMNDNGDVIATISIDDFLWVWDRAGRVAPPLSDREGRAPSTIALSPNGSMLAIGGRDAVVAVRGTFSGDIRLRDSLESDITAIAFDRSGELLVVGTDSGRIYIADLRSASPSLDLFVADSIPCGPSRIRQIILGMQKSWIAVAYKHCIAVFDTRGKLLMRDSIDAFALGAAPDNGTIAAGNDYGLVYLYNTRTWEKAPYPLQVGSDLSDPDPCWITSVMFDSSGKRLSAISHEKKFYTWEIESSSIDSASIGGFRGIIINSLFSFDGTKFATLNAFGDITLWNTRSGDSIGRWADLPGTRTDLHGMFALDPRHPDKIYVAGWLQGLTPFDLSLLAASKKLRSDLPLTNIVFRNDGKRLATVSSTGQMISWTTDPMPTLADSFSFGKSGYADSYRTAVDRNLCLLAVCDDDSVALWDINRKRRIDARRIVRAPYDSRVVPAAINPKGTLLAVGGARLQLWSVGLRGFSTLLDERDAGNPRILAFNATGEMLASSSKRLSVTIWRSDGGTLRELNVFEYPRNLDNFVFPDKITALAFSPDGTMLAVGDDLGFIFLWDIASGKLVGQLNGHDDVAHLEFSADSRNLISTAGSVIVWEIDPAKWASRVRALATP